jgi:hypothetical protein
LKEQLDPAQPFVQKLEDFLARISGIHQNILPNPLLSDNVKEIAASFSLQASNVLNWIHAVQSGDTKAPELRQVARNTGEFMYALKPRYFIGNVFRKKMILFLLRNDLGPFNYISSSSSTVLSTPPAVVYTESTFHNPPGEFSTPPPPQAGSFFNAQSIVLLVVAVGIILVGVGLLVMFCLRAESREHTLLVDYADVRLDDLNQSNIDLFDETDAPEEL